MSTVNDKALTAEPRSASRIYALQQAEEAVGDSLLIQKLIKKIKTVKNMFLHA
jgi:hypothetical protein